MESKRFDIATIEVNGADVRIKYADLLVVRKDNTAELDWELVVVPFDGAPLESGAHHVEVVTLEGRSIGGDAIHVRSIDGTHVLRGAGPLAGLADDDL
jgi:hypothetical protein